MGIFVREVLKVINVFRFDSKGIGLSSGDVGRLAAAIPWEKHRVGVICA